MYNIAIYEWFKRFTMIDSDGFRKNVCIILMNDAQQVLWARRIYDAVSWQFPQGGFEPNETSEQAMFRELREEIGLLPHHVSIISYTPRWLKYRLPAKYVRKNSTPKCIGQKQVWYLLKLIASEDNIDLQSSQKPEFDHWQWVDYWTPVEEVIYFKKEVYQRALESFVPALSQV